MKKLILCLFCLPTAVFAANDCNSRKTVPDTTMDLQSVIEMGLCRNPQTAAAYLSSESARLSKNAGYAPYLPSLSASASATKPYRNSEFGDVSYGASLSASYLIFDFGKRLSDLNTLSAVWRATEFDYDESVQNYVYSIIGSYYALLNADADVATAESLYTVSKTAFDTAEKRFKAGSVARADVLKAGTTMASRDLDRVRAKNNREIAKGKLLTGLSFSPESDIKIADMPTNFGSITDNKSIDDLIASAQKSRPDLLRASANRDAALYRRNSAFLKNLPSVSAVGTLSYDDAPAYGVEKTSGSIGVRASMPIFAGFANLYGVRAANINLERAHEMERQASESANFDIFSAYKNYKTSQNVLIQTSALLKSAAESERASAGMYRVGRANMLEWQTAQADLASAEKQNNAAKYDVFVKRAAVALSIGEIKSEIK